MQFCLLFRILVLNSNVPAKDISSTLVPVGAFTAALSLTNSPTNTACSSSTVQLAWHSIADTKFVFGQEVYLMHHLALEVVKSHQFPGNDLCVPENQVIHIFLQTIVRLSDYNSLVSVIEPTAILSAPAKVFEQIF